jgi:cytochrome c-type biogenesis protein CcmF
MSVEIGHFALVLALALSIVQSVVPVIGARRRDTQLMSVAVPTAIAVFALVCLSSAVLVHAYVVSDFSVLNVVENSHSQKPLLYKITGVWGNHEGSMLLWVFILTLFSALVAAFSGNLPETLRANVLAVQGWIGVAFLAFIIFTSNPFTRILPAPMEGGDLNPILQDIGLAIHPPLLYLGYVGFSVCFSFAVAALLEGRLDAAWARWVRPWTLVAWTFLTGGIAMGSYWAYYELGWGGWWFWDPVENASFMPWLVSSAGDPDLLAVAAWNFPRPLGRADFGTQFCDRSRSRAFHSRHSRHFHRRFFVAVCPSRAKPDGGWHFPSNLAGRGIGLQQPVPDHCRRDCSDRHTLSAAA